jgi:hypothetical protein
MNGAEFIVTNKSIRADESRISILIEVGKLYRIHQGTVCWNETGKILNDLEKKSGIVMVLDEPIQKNLDGFTNSEVRVLLETGEIGWIYDYHYNAMELIEH